MVYVDELAQHIVKLYPNASVRAKMLEVTRTLALWAGMSGRLDESYTWMEVATAIRRTLSATMFRPEAHP